MIILALITVFLGTFEGCIEIGQVCYKCQGNINQCNDGSFTYTSAEGCISHVMNLPALRSGHFNPLDSKCFPYSCSNNIYFIDTTAFTIRKTCNSDCTNFTLTEYSFSKVTNPALSSYSVGFSQCFEDCFDTYGCTSFTYNFDGFVCSLYTCGQSCSIVFDLTTLVYARTCHSVTDCGSLNDPANGVVDISDGTTYTHVANYSCTAGYKLSGNETRECQANEIWSGSEPSCVAVDCGELPAPTNGDVNILSGTIYGRVATYNCTDGYTLNGTANSRVCQSDATWSESEPNCIPRDCGPLSPPLYGEVDTPSGTIYNSQANYSCVEGYTLHGLGIRTCLVNELWSGTSPSCSPVDCGHLAPPVKGAVDISSGTTYNNTAIYSCLNGYVLLGNDTRVCRSNGQWTGGVPICSGIDCGALLSPLNANARVPQGTQYPSRASFTCTSGYVLQGNKTRKCLANGNWSGSQPSCNLVDCNLPIVPDNGTVSFNATTFGNNATFSCNPGFSLHGHTVVMCNSNGLWDPAPSCRSNGTSVVEPIKLYILPCICYPNKTFTGMTQGEIIDFLIQSTRIQTNSTALALRKLKSAHDSRASSRVIGYIGAFIITGGIGLLMLTDLTRLCQNRP